MLAPAETLASPITRLDFTMKRDNIMMKRFISLILAFALCATFSVPAFAADGSLSADVMESKIAADIQSEQERIFSSVYAQLEEQDALSLMDTID